MNSKFVLAAAVLLSLATGPAFAESDGNPFPFQAAAQLTSGRAVLVDTGSAAYPAFTGSNNQPSSLASLEPAYDYESAVQTAGSLPRNFDQGTVTAARAPATRVLEAGKLRPAG